MDALKELIRLISKKRIKKVELFDEANRGKSSNYFKLFEGIHSDKYQLDDDAAKDIYNCEPSEKRYLILKTRLKQKLLNTLFFLDSDEGNTYQSVVYECHKNLYSAKVLLLHQSSQMGIPLLEKVLKKADQFELTEVVWECAKTLRVYYSQNGQYREFLFYKEREEQMEKRMILENLSGRYHQELRMLNRKQKYSNAQLWQLAEKHYRTLEEKLDEQTSSRLKANFYQVKMLFYQFSNNVSAAIDTATELERFITQKAALFENAEWKSVILAKIGFYLQNQDFENGWAYFQQTLPTFNEPVSESFQFRQAGFLLALHTENYGLAGQVFQQSVEHPAFRLLSDNEKRNWQLFQFYLTYLHKIEKINDLKQASQLTKTHFSLIDFQSLPEFDKKQKVIHLNILTGQILFYLDKMETTAIIHIVNAMQNYCRTYPKKDAFFRCESFVLMLTKMVEEDFRFYQTRRAAEKIFEDLKNESLDTSGQTLEILRYETLWNLILEKLKSHRYG